MQGKSDTQYDCRIGSESVGVILSNYGFTIRIAVQVKTDREDDRKHVLYGEKD